MSGEKYKELKKEIKQKIILVTSKYEEKECCFMYANTVFIYINVYQ